MKKNIINHLKKLPVLILVLFCLLSVQAYASVPSQSDSVSTTDVQFTPIISDTSSATVSNSVVSDKKPDQKEATVKAVKNNDQSLSLWTIFIEGFIGGFAALLLPCIF